MTELLFSLVLANGVLFTVLSGWAVWTARREPSPRLRVLAWLVAMTSVAFVLSAGQRLAFQAIRLGWISPESSDFLLTEWQVFQSLVALGLAVVGLVMLAGVWPSFRRTERMVTTLVARLPEELSVEDLDLTPRELEVLEVIGEGCLSDREIADALYIAPATAQTHVKRILGKAGLGNRRQLMLLHAKQNANGRA